MNRSTPKIAPITTGHFQKRVAVFRLLGSIAFLIPFAALLHKWMQDCSVSILPLALGAIAFCAVLMRLIDFKKQLDPADISSSQDIFWRLGSLDPQYEYDRNIKWLKARWGIILSLISLLFVSLDLFVMTDLCSGNYAYSKLVGSDLPVQASGKNTH